MREFATLDPLFRALRTIQDQALTEAHQQLQALEAGIGRVPQLAGETDRILHQRNLGYRLPIRTVKAVIAADLAQSIGIV